MRAKKYFWVQIVDTIGLKGENDAKQHTLYKVSFRLWVDSLKKRVEMYQMARVDMITNQADKRENLRSYEVVNRF